MRGPHARVGGAVDRAQLSPRACFALPVTTLSPAPARPDSRRRAITRTATSDTVVHDAITTSFDVALTQHHARRAELVHHQPRQPASNDYHHFLTPSSTRSVSARRVPPFSAVAELLLPATAFAWRAEHRSKRAARDGHDAQIARAFDAPVETVRVSDGVLDAQFTRARVTAPRAREGRHGRGGTLDRSRRSPRTIIDRARRRQRRQRAPRPVARRARRPTASAATRCSNRRRSTGSTRAVGRGQHGRRPDHRRLRTGHVRRERRQHVLLLLRSGARHHVDQRRRWTDPDRQRQRRARRSDLRRRRDRRPRPGGRRSRSTRARRTAAARPTSTPDRRAKTPPRS